MHIGVSRALDVTSTKLCVNGVQLSKQLCVICKSHACHGACLVSGFSFDLALANNARYVMLYINT